MRLDPVYLTEIASNYRTYQKALAYVRQNRVDIFDTNTHPDGSLTFFADVSGTYDYQTTVTMSTDFTTLESYDCDCPAYSRLSGACKHIIAVAIAADIATDKRISAAFNTDPAVERLLSCYASQAAPAPDPAALFVKLVPTLMLSESALYLSFKLGYDKFYILRDLDRFYGLIRDGASDTYGKKLSFVHRLENFEPDSARLVQLILHAYQNLASPLPCMQAASRHFYGGSPAREGRLLSLPPFLLDELLDIYIGKSLSFAIGGPAQDYRVLDHNPPLSLHVAASKGDTFQLSLSKTCFVLEGLRRYAVCIPEESTIYLCGDPFIQGVKPLFNALSGVPGKHNTLLTLLSKDMPALVNMVLPRLKPYLPLKTEADLTKFARQPLECRVYLDLAGTDTVTARLEFHYGAEQVWQGFQPRDNPFLRDTAGETAMETLLLQYFQYDEERKLLLSQGLEAIFHLVETGVGEISQKAAVLVSDAFGSLRIRSSFPSSVGVRIESNLLALSLDFGDIDPAEYAEILDAYRQARKYHRLRDGSYLNLTDTGLAEIAQLVQGLNIQNRDLKKGQVQVPAYRALYLDSLLNSSQRVQFQRDPAVARMVEDVRHVAPSSYALPPDLEPILRPYQKAGYRWMRAIAAYGFGGILADDMGLGKTLQVLALFSAQKRENTEHRVSLVVCPSSLVLNWKQEAQKFTPDLDVAAVTGNGPQRRACIARLERADLAITSYDLLKRDLELYMDIPFFYVVADEAQYMKNQNTQTAKAVKALRSTVRLALTGTPVENSLAELWSIFDFLMPGYLFHYARFRSAFELPIAREKDQQAAETLREMVAPFLLRRMKAQVLQELPEKIETVMYAEFAPAQRKLYVAKALSARQEVESGYSRSNKLQVLALITRLRQICCDPSLAYENYRGGSAKLDLCMELVTDSIASGRRVLLFSQFTSMLDILSCQLKKEGIPFFTITGHTKASQRVDLVNQFNQGDVPLFLISLKAGGTGLNLTGADVVIHYDPWWNNSAQNQATDRAHRIGQTRSVQVYRLIAKDTLEERILEMQQEKAHLADQIIREGEGAFARMSKAEILSLFQ